LIRIEVENDLCVGCKMGAHICPEMVLGMAGGYVPSIVRPEKCTLCLACEQQCPEGAIKVYKN
jgi:NAD-dependent dihydropyrimidine dehydrogenase PreA subunit